MFLVEVYNFEKKKIKSIDCIWNRYTFSCQGLNFFWNLTLCACEPRLSYVTVCITYSPLLLQPDAPVFLFLLLILHSVAWKSKNACHSVFLRFKGRECKHDSPSAWTMWNFNKPYKSTLKYTSGYYQSCVSTISWVSVKSIVIKHLYPFNSKV